MVVILNKGDIANLLDIRVDILESNIEYYENLISNNGYCYKKINSHNDTLYLFTNKLKLKGRVDIEAVLREDYSISDDDVNDVIDSIINIYENDGRNKYIDINLQKYPQLMKKDFHKETMCCIQLKDSFINKIIKI